MYGRVQRQSPALLPGGPHYGNMTRAAERLNLSQSAVSGQIKQLGRIWDIPWSKGMGSSLFSRMRGGLRLLMQMRSVRRGGNWSEPCNKSGTPGRPSASLHWPHCRATFKLSFCSRS
ncbi:LysR family transcriptional regulator [Hoeflea sp. AS60]|uniref:helix-turn-helix domain-containing protein n=1 Tax=Hoeflea sp. AS60 TaxID=3135780 RepID=UPI003171D547